MQVPARVMVDQREDLGPHDRIVCGFALDPRDDVGRVAIHRRFEQIADAALLVGRHEELISRKSHARASAHRRFSVAGDMPRASAVSSMLSPAK